MCSDEDSRHKCEWAVSCRRKEQAFCFEEHISTGVHDGKISLSGFSLNVAEDRNFAVMYTNRVACLACDNGFQSTPRKSLQFIRIYITCNTLTDITAERCYLVLLMLMYMLQFTEVKDFRRNQLYVKDTWESACLFEWIKPIVCKWLSILTV